jgi:hypothetical protein
MTVRSYISVITTAVLTRMICTTTAHCTLLQQRLIGELKESLRLVKRLESAVYARHRRIDARMAELQSVLTPRQAAALILWVTKHEAELQVTLTEGEQQRAVAVAAAVAAAAEAGGDSNGAGSSASAAAST